jgi:dihydropteroate synthase
LHRELDVIISIDTSKTQVMREAATAGAGLINDVMALRAEGAIEAVLETGLPVCLMHMQGEPRTMQQNPHYTDVVNEVKNFLRQRASECITMGMDKSQIIIDPGFGFGKSLEHNIKLFKHLNALNELGYPVLVGASRKSMLGQITSKDITNRLAGSLSLATIAVLRGAKIIRAHDVAETVDAVAVADIFKTT